MRTFHLRIIVAALLLSTFVLIGKSQEQEKTEEEIEFEKKVSSLMTSVIDEVPNLRLWENRALLYSGLGNMLWDKDQKQAKQLFDLAGQELANGIDPPEVQTTDWNVRNIQRSNFTPRRSVILTISKKDPVSALEILKSSRPRKVQEAIDKLARFPKDMSALTDAQKRAATNANRRANNEISLEQAIAEKAAERDPKIAIALLKESLKKGVSVRAINLLNKIAEADMETARKLKDDLVSKLVESPINQRDYSFSNTLRVVLQKSSETGNKESVFEKQDLESIANKVADYYMRQKNVSFVWGFELDRKLVSKYAPSRKAEMEQKRRDYEERMQPFERENLKVLQLMNDKTLSPADLVEKAKGLRNFSKQAIYRNAIDRAEKAGKLDEVRVALDNAPASAEKDEALNLLGEKESKAALKSSDTEKIEQILDSATTDIARIKVLSKTAVVLYENGDDEKKKRALEYLEEAKEIVGDQIVTRQDVLNQLELIPAVAKIEPNSTFDRFEKLVTLVNRLTAASAVMREFDSRTPYSYEGEYFFPNIFGKTFEKHGPTLKSVAKEDLSELIDISRRFMGPELRLLAQFAILQGLLNEQLGFPENRRVMFTSYSNEL